MMANKGLSGRGSAGCNGCNDGADRREPVLGRQGAASALASPPAVQTPTRAATPCQPELTALESMLQRVEHLHGHLNELASIANRAFGMDDEFHGVDPQPVELGMLERLDQELLVVLRRTEHLHLRFCHLA